MSHASTFEGLEHAVRNLFARHWRYVVIFFAIFFAFYFSEFAEYTMRVDEELAANRIRVGTSWIAMGRWGAWLIEATIVARPLNPYFSMVCFGVLLSLSFLMYCKIARIDSPFVMIAGFALFAGFPTWYYILEFKGTMVACGIAVFLAVAAGLLFAMRRPVSRLLFVLCVTVSISIYQSTVLLAVAVSITSLLARIDDDSPPILRSLAELTLLVLCAALLYVAISMLLLTWTGLELNYVTHYMRFSDLVNDPRLVLGAVGGRALGIYAGTGGIYHDAIPITGILFALGLLALALRPNHRLRGWSYSLPLLLLVAILVSVPFWINLVGGNDLPTRSLLAVPVVFSFMAFEALRSGSRAIRLGAGCLTVVLVFQYFQLASFASFSHQFVAAHDLLVAGQVYDRMTEEIEDFDRNKTYPVEFAGALQFPNSAAYLRGHTAVTGSSIFEWGGGNPYRIAVFMRLLGMGRFRVIAPSQRNAIRERIEAMPSWPSTESVRNIDGTIVVKFGDYAPWTEAEINVEKFDP